MAAPLYFFAGRSRNDLVDAGTRRFRAAPLASAGLEETWRDVTAPDEQGSLIELTAKGPGSKSGLLVTIFPRSGEAPKRLGYYPEFQRWIEIDDGLHIGVDVEQPPSPADLLRSGRVHGGFNLELADGRTWTAPIVRRPQFAVERGCAATDLPQDIGWDLAGKFQQTLKSEFQPLFDDAAELCELFFGATGGNYEISIEQGLKWAIRLLSLNYRYGRHEQNLLHAVDASNVMTILGAAIDWPTARNLRPEPAAVEPVAIEPAAAGGE